MYGRMPQNLKDDIDHRAEIHRDYKQHEREQEVEHLRARRDLLLQRCAHSQSSPPISLRTSAFGPRDLQRFDSLWTSDDQFQSNDVHLLRDDALRCPLPTPATTIAEMDRVVIDVAVPDAVLPSWAKSICSQREHFMDCVLVAHVDNKNEYFKFLYAVKSPMYIALCRISLVPMTRPMENVHGKNFSDFNAQLMKMRFHVNFADVCSSEDLVIDGDSNLAVITDAKHLGGMVIETLQAPVPLNQYLRFLPSVCPVAKAAAKKRTDHVPKDLLASYPWLQALDAKTGFSDGNSSCPSGSSTARPARVLARADDLDDDDVERVWADLHRARGALAAHEAVGQDFKVTALGGLWLQRTHGVSTDAVRGHAASGGAVQWCRGLAIPLSCKFAFSVYGAEAPAILARGWVMRMQHLYDHVHMAARFDGDIDEAKNSFIESEEFVTLALAARGSLLQRIQQIRSLLL